MARILIVDDDMTNREFLVSLLGYQQHELFEAADGAEALMMAREYKPHLVITDILMPTMDGYEFVHLMRNEPEIADTIVIFYTAHYHEKEARNLADACNVSFILTKPTEPEFVLKTVNEALQAKIIAKTNKLKKEKFDSQHTQIITDKLAEKVRELEAINHRLNTLIEINLHLASEHNSQQLLDDTCRTARDLICSKYALLVVRDKNDNDKLHYSAYGMSQSIKNGLSEPELKKGIFAEVFNENMVRRYQLSGKNIQESGFPDGYPAITSALVAPVKSLTNTYGWLCLNDKLATNVFSNEDEQLIGILGGQVGRIYENGSLLKKTRNYAEKLVKEIAARKQTELTLQQANEKLTALIESSPLAIIVLDKSANVQMWNPAAETLFQWTKDEVMNKPYPLIPDKDIDSFKAVLEQLFNGQLSQRAEELKRKRKDGKLIDVELWTAPLHDIDGNINFVLGMLVDITERKHSEEKISRLTRIHEVLSGINSTIVRIHDRDALFQEVCRIAINQGEFGLAWVGMLEDGGFDIKPAACMTHDGGDAWDIASNRSMQSKDIVGRCLRQKVAIVCNDIKSEVDKGLKSKEVLDRGFHSVIALPLIIEEKSVGIIMLYAMESDYFDEEELALLNELAEDVSFALEYIQKSEKLNYMAYYEPITGLANRTLFLERLKQYISSAQYGKGKLGVMLLDINRFKAINDAMGWHTGDMLLRMVADRLANRLGSSDKLAHIGADYFAAIFPGIRDESDIGHIIEKDIMSCFNQPFMVHDNELRVSAKIGISLFPTDGITENVLFKNAESAVKKAKDTGERYLFYTREMTDLISEKLKLENKLVNALKQNEFVVYYQPIIEFSTGKISGLEALLRWNDPETGLVPPFKFIPTLEDTGLIVDVGQWVLDKAASDYRRWQKQLGHAPRIKVNVSPLQLKQNNFVEEIERAIRSHGKPVPIDVEITESIIMEEIEANISKLKTIRLAGLGVAIDDFGTGYSSLSYLARLPVDALKIDRSFIESMANRTESMTIVSTIITLAHSLGLKVIAEGVETEEQKKLLTLLKCDEMQGYLFSKPLPPENIPDLLKKYY